MHTRQKNGTHRIPHGGTGIISAKDATIPFCDNDDITGLWNDLKNTTRVTAAWIQISRKLKILAFSFYGFPCVTSEFEEIHNTNNEILQKILEISAQFGDIPIVIGGDFQDEPFSYEAVRKASFTGWTDPIQSLNDDPQQGRPITFSRSGNFVDVTEQISSIDGLLLNQVATAALSRVEVVTGDARQHAPIRAFFSWPKIFLKGFEIIRPAAFEFSQIVSRDGKPDQDSIREIGLDLWQNGFEDCTKDPSDEKAWQAINQFGIDILSKSGAMFLKGPKTRGRKPVFREKVVCPGQTFEGSAVNAESAWYCKTHSLIAELRIRLQRPSNKTSDMLITLRLQNKVVSRIKQISWCMNWDPQLNLNDGDLAINQKFLQQTICSLRQKEKYARINAWRNK